MGVEVIPPIPLFLDYDSPECWKDPEKFWQTVDEGYGETPLPSAWQPYYSDLDSQLTSVLLTESTQPEQSEEGTVTVGASVSQSSSLISENFSEDSQNYFFRRQYRDTDPPSYFDVRRAASAIVLLPDQLEEIDDTEYVLSCSDSDNNSLEEVDRYDWFAYTYNACKVESEKSLCFSVRVEDASLDEIGDPANLNNYLPDSSATQYMTPKQADWYDAIEGPNLGVEVANGHII